MPDPQPGDEPVQIELDRIAESMEDQVMAIEEAREYREALQGVTKDGQ